MIDNVPLNAFLILSTLMFFIGIYGFLTRRNLITMLMSIELILNSVNINFVVFNKFLYPNHLHGHFFSLIVIAVAAAEAAVAIAIIINIYRNFKSIDVDNLDQMKL
ncbi:MAG: NADH-quinone oxidoreductase subunit NuoK [Prolixibacteraceae bacterium]|jgi:NADH-quinone oxidoreductase subunit K|nr:NADH-quinone oxidoreductase subunit NuoK [Prolixibacteraceae bacterium]